MTTPASTPFERLSDRELACLYRALCLYITSPESGAWFHHADKGDPGYRLAAEAREGSPSARIDRADRNPLFAIGHRVHTEIEHRNQDLFKYSFPPGFVPAFETWETFCRAVSSAPGPGREPDLGPSSSSAQDRLTPLGE